MYREGENWKETIDKTWEDPSYIGNVFVEEFKARRIIYNKEFIREDRLTSAKGKLGELEGDFIQWIEVTGLHKVEEVKEITDFFDLHPLTVEDILNMNQGPKIEEYQDYIFINTKNLFKLDSDIVTEQISFILKGNSLITFKETDREVFSNIEKRLRANSPIRSLNIDILLYSLLDTLVDDYFLVLDLISEKIDDVEDRLLMDPEKDLLHEIYKLKRNLVYIRKLLWPMRNILNRLSRDDYYHIETSSLYYFRDIYDHLIQMIDIVETYRDICSGMLDTYLSSIGNKTNDIMRILTVFSTISVPLTFLTGVYGMNFKYQPELNWKYSYGIFWILSIFITLGMLKYFKDRDWI